tara:strand:- start:409 stop:2310 length:1902 start_codon:yes stop_codon:yes gene_type:complete
MALTKISGSILKDPLNLGEVSIGGTLTYQDVTNVDSIGIITARSGIDAPSNLLLRTGGTERLRIASTGQVLIGTTTEGAADADDLTISSSTNTAGITIRTNTTGTGRLWFSDGTSGAAEYQGYIQYDHNNQRLSLGSGGGSKITVRHTGYVGINSTSPAYPLDVLEPTDNSGLISIRGSNDGYDTGFLIRNGPNPKWYLINDVNGTGGHSFEIRGDGWSNDRFFTVTQSGDVGIGVNDPDAKLEVLEDIFVKGSSGDGDTGIQIRSGSSALSNQHQIRTGGGNGNMLFLEAVGNTGIIAMKTAGSERLRIDAGGGLQLGTSTATASKFTVYGANDAAAIFQGSGTGTGAANGFLVGNNGGTTGLLWNYENGDTKIATNNVERLRIESGGDIQFINADSIIHTSANTSRLRLFGGSTNSVSNGAALTLHGVSHSAGNYADLASGTGGHIQFRVGTTEKNRIDSSGLSGNIKNNYALVAFITDRDDGSRSTGSTSYQDDTGLVLTNAITYQHGDILFVRANCPTGVALVSTDTANYQGVGVRIKITPSSGTTRYSNETRGWYRNDGRATKETQQMSTTIYHLIASNTSQFSNNVTLSFQVQYKRDPGGTGSYGATGLSNWSGERTLEVWQFRKQL